MEEVNFGSLEVSKEILKAVTEMGFEEMTPIQSQAIPFLLSGRDVIGQARTGTGKTAAFGIPLLEAINTKVNKPQGLVLCPTRELAIQVSEALNKLSKYKKGLKVLPIYGGQSIDRQISALRKGIHIVIGTPGRVMDHINRKTLQMDLVNKIVLDEADEMLDMGFREDIEFVLDNIATTRQIALFSATMAKPILDLSKKYLNNPELVKVVHKDLTVPNIKQFYYEMHHSEKLDIAAYLLDKEDYKSAIVFCNTKKMIDELTFKFLARGFFAGSLHGDLKQSQRDKVMKEFRTGQIDVLVATDVAARGLDINNVELVLNYDVPQDEEYYVHRIGRTGRAGKDGVAYTFVTRSERFRLKDIEQFAKTKITKLRLPSSTEIADIKLTYVYDLARKVMESFDLKLSEAKILEEFDAEELPKLAAALIKMNVSADISEELDAIERNKAQKEIRVFLNIGELSGVRARDIVGAITNEAKLNGSQIGQIDIFKNFTFVNVKDVEPKKLIDTLNKCKIKGKKINAEIAREK